MFQNLKLLRRSSEIVDASELVSRQDEVADDVVNDILDYMLEGWYFGETESKFSVAGKVPSIKPGGFIRSGQDQISASTVAAAKAKKRREDKKKGVITNQNKQGEFFGIFPHMSIHTFVRFSLILSISMFM